MASCPQNSILYNGSHCACQVGRFLNVSAYNCITYDPSSAIKTDSGVDYYAISFPKTFISFDSIENQTKSQAVFLEATLVMLLSWLLFCFFLRFTNHGDGRNVWFKIRWWISRLDVCFATRHWLWDSLQILVSYIARMVTFFSLSAKPGCGPLMLPSVHGNGPLRGGGTSRKQRQLTNTGLIFASISAVKRPSNAIYLDLLWTGRNIASVQIMELPSSIKHFLLVTISFSHFLR
ncbi:uncharacterized protein LOC120151677 [Hibiscus syriacus]|uniref:uncharacterized protein LOC120151677 n=1 Tax=Hibiscus syriacus TaxID=106335 RepID=UPI001923D826|nr:uncharacterized protein LOC120151677 [Hibiscus syriacus]XP_039019990.1 uncharacterized protein LOC120151677 [Hibiscus syriacus]